MGPKPYEFIGFGDLHGPKPYEFIRFGDLHGPKPYEFIRFGDPFYGSPADRAEIGPRWRAGASVKLGRGRGADPDGRNPRYVLKCPFINITIVDLGPFRPQINKSILDFGVRGASWGVLAPPGRSSNQNNPSNHYFNTKLGLSQRT